MQRPSFMFIHRVKEPSVFRGNMHLLRMSRYASRVRVNQPLCSAAGGLLILLYAHVEPNPCGYSQLLLLGLSCKAKWAGPKRVCLLTSADSQSNNPRISFDSLYLLRKALFGNAPKMATCRSVQSLCSAAWGSLIGAGRSTFLGSLASTWLQINIDPLHVSIVWLRTYRSGSVKLLNSRLAMISVRPTYQTTRVGKQWNGGIWIYSAWPARGDSRLWNGKMFGKMSQQIFLKSCQCSLEEQMSPAVVRPWLALRHIRDSRDARKHNLAGLQSRFWHVPYLSVTG